MLPFFCYSNKIIHTENEIRLLLSVEIMISDKIDSGCTDFVQQNVHGNKFSLDFHQEKEENFIFWKPPYTPSFHKLNA